MDWADSLKRIRRYLRDPAPGRIWTDEELRQYFNDAAFEIAQKVGPIVRVETYNFPPEYDWSYTHDWEMTYGEGTQFQALTVNQADGWVVSYPWEVAYWLDVAPTGDDGYRCTNPWEMVLGSPADVVPIPLHGKFHKNKIACWDEEPIDPIDEWTLAQQDGNYRLREGKPAHYYRLDEHQNRIVLYPRPSPVWDETDTSEVLADTGGENANESWLDRQGTGIASDIISTENTLFMAYEAMPVDVQGSQDEPDFARYMVKYIEYATLERAYSADTDGFVPTLRDYWGTRKKIGIEALKRWKRMGLQNRNHRLGGAGRGMGQVARVRLPSHYPQVT